MAFDRNGREIELGDIVSHPDFYGTTMKVVRIEGAMVFGTVVAIAGMKKNGRKIESFTARDSYICKMK